MVRVYYPGQDPTAPMLTAGQGELLRRTYYPTVLCTKNTSETTMPDEQTNRIHPDVPQEDFDDLLFALLADWNPRGLVLEIPGLYVLVAEFFRDRVHARWRQELVGPGTDSPVVEATFAPAQWNDEDSPEDNGWYCDVCDELVANKMCMAHPYAAIYQSLLD